MPPWSYLLKAFEKAHRYTRQFSRGTRVVALLKACDSFDAKDTDDDTHVEVKRELTRKGPYLASPGVSRRLSWDDIDINEECSICCEILRCQCEENRKPVIRMTSCAHGFHLGCVRNWMQTGGGSCPLCRSDQRKLKKRLLGAQHSGP